MRGFHSKVLLHFDYVVLGDHVTNKTQHISTDTMAIDNKLGRVVKYCERLPLLQPHEP